MKNLTVITVTHHHRMFFHVNSVPHKHSERSNPPTDAPTHECLEFQDARISVFYRPRREYSQKIMDL